MFERRESSGSGSSLVAAEGTSSQKRPFMIGVAGGTASGKVCDLMSTNYLHTYQFNLFSF